MNLFPKFFKKAILPVAVAGIFLTSAALGAEGELDASEHPAVFGFGFHGGMNFNDFNYTSNTATNASKSRTGYLAGLHFAPMSLGAVALRLETNYSVKGYDIANIARVNHNYLQIPLLFKIAPIVGPIEIFAEAGPAVAIHLSTTTELANTGITYTDNANSTDWSLIGGLGVGIHLDRVLLEVEGRYDYGLTNISNTNNIEVKSRAIQAIVGLTFLM